MTRRRSCGFHRRVPSSLPCLFEHGLGQVGRGLQRLEARVLACSSRRGACGWPRRAPPTAAAARSAPPRDRPPRLEPPCVAVSVLSLSVRRRPVSESSLCALSRRLHRGALLERLHALWLRGPGFALSCTIRRSVAATRSTCRRFRAALLQIRRSRLHVALQLGDRSGVPRARRSCSALVFS